MFPSRYIKHLLYLKERDAIAGRWYLNHQKEIEKLAPGGINPLLGALASTALGGVGERAGGADGLVALADVAADVVVTTTDLTVDGSLVLGTANALEVRGLGLLAGGGVDVTTLGEGDLAVVAGALATDLDFGTGELLGDTLVDAGLDGWKVDVSSCTKAELVFGMTYWSQKRRGRGR